MPRPIETVRARTYDRILNAFPAFVLCFVLLTMPTSGSAQRFNILYSFTGVADGKNPTAGVIIGPDGSLYGTTAGAYDFHSPCEKAMLNCGTVFKLSPTAQGWNFNILYTFHTDANGAAPGRITFGPDGNLYGVTFAGGVFQQCFYPLALGCGVVYKLSPSQSQELAETVLYRFKGPNDGDGQVPIGAPVFDAAGNIYGATLWGGYLDCDSQPCGTVYELSPTADGWVESALYRFDENNGIRGPQPSEITIDPAGHLYGTTLGHTCTCDQSVGGPYQLSPPRDLPYWGAKGLPFSAPNVSPRRGGFDPSGGLTFDSEGSLYGVTLGGGLYLQGAVYKLYPSTAGDANWTFTIPYSFNGEPNSGPYGKLSIDAAGALYGMREVGPEGYSKAYKLMLKGDVWDYSELHDFSADRQFAPGYVAIDKNGNLYGTATTGGAYGYGYVWEIEQ